MRRFTCPVCEAEIHFDTLTCLNCGTALAYAPDAVRHVMVGGAHSACSNREAIGCNWVVGRRNHGTLCDACVLTETIPDLSVPGNQTRWAKIEEAKRRLVYSLLRLGLPLESQAGNRLTFRLLGDEVLADGSVRKVMTGHDNGLVTLNIAEADDATREATRVQMGEPYRTLLGHFRHEVGHFYFDVLVEEEGHRDGFAALFGDPDQDYQEAIDRHYAEGPPADWADAFVSAYATMHPWEDWAETWAHWMHMTDGLETAVRYGLASGIEPYGEEITIERLVEDWVPLSIAMNAMNRAMGQADFYPFVIAPKVVGKLDLVHGLVHGRRG